MKRSAPIEWYNTGSTQPDQICFNIHQKPKSGRRINALLHRKNMQMQKGIAAKAFASERLRTDPQPTIREAFYFLQQAKISQRKLAEQRALREEDQQRKRSQSKRKTERDYQATLALAQSDSSSMSRRKSMTQKLLGFTNKGLLAHQNAGMMHQHQLGLLPLLTNSCKYPKNNKSRNTYIALTKQITEKQKSAMGIAKALLKQFTTAFQETHLDSFWKNLNFQLAVYDPKLTLQQNKAYMCISSLKLIHQEFHLRLRGEQQFQGYVKPIVAKLEKKQVECGKQGILWAKVWIAYLTGNRTQVQNLISSHQLNHSDLGRLYQLTEQRILAGKPQKYEFKRTHNTQDVFYNQFQYCLQGNSFIASEKIAPIQSLELVLIAVRTLGIFYPTQEEQFQVLRKKMVNFYLQNGPDEEKIRFMLLLLDYDTILKMGENSLMRQEDYLHFLIVMAGFPGLITESSFQKRLTFSLVSFIKQLFTENRHQYIHYIQLLPDQQRAQCTSQIIAQKDYLDKFDWQGLRNLLKKEQFNQIVSLTTEKYSLKDGHQIRAALKLVQLCKDYQKACSYLLTYCVYYQLELRKYKIQEVGTCLRLGFTWAEQRTELAAYKKSFQFIYCFNQLLGLLRQNEINDFKEFVAGNQFIVVDLTSNNPNYKEVFRMLYQSHGLGLYYRFLELAVQGLNSCLDCSEDQERAKQNLKQLKTTLRKQVQQIQQLPFVDQRIENQHLQRLEQVINEEVSQLK